MKRTQGFRLVVSLGLIALEVIALGASPAQADTTANGPYYATPSWDQTLPVATRFIVLSNFNSQAILDRETGLVWLRGIISQVVPWSEAIDRCRRSVGGDRMGWRLPTVAELLSLLDPLGQTSPRLPAGHPFGVIPSPYQFWSASTSEDSLTEAFVVTFNVSGGPGGPPAFPLPKFASNGGAWCVRGGQGV